MSSQGGRGSLHPVSGPGPGGDGGPGGEAGGLAAGVRQDPGAEARLVMAGHSAGAHLAAMMLASDWFTNLDKEDAEVFRGVVHLSGEWIHFY